MGLEEDTYTSIFTALKHPVRRRILRMLDEGPATYTEVLNGLGAETGFLNYHLEGLQWLVRKDAENRYQEVVYYLNLTLRLICPLSS